MATGPGRNFPAVFSACKRLLGHMWKPLVWVWVTIIVGIGINVGSSWLTTQGTSFTLHGTPLGWLIEHPWEVFAFIVGFSLLTLMAWMASQRAETPAAQTAQRVILTPQQRLQVIRSLQQEYTSRLSHSLQGRVAIELGLHTRTEVIASSAQLIFHHADTATNYALPPGTSIIQVYDDVQRGLLILGAPGSGKTTLLLDLVVELLQRAESDPDHPIPIILNLSSWATKKLAFPDWFNEQLSFVYGIPKRVGASWITSDEIMFLLDGLDEVEATTRSACIDAMNTYRQEHLVPLVVCSRSQEYECQQARLILPAAVEIQPLEPARVTAYLNHAGKSLAAVRTVLRNNHTLQQLLTTPLMLNIVILTYQGKAMKDFPQMGSPDDQQRQIFAHYVEYVLERRATRGSYAPQQTQHWLIWLAEQMQQHHLTEFYLELLQLTWLPTKRSQTLNGMLSGPGFLGLAGALFGTLVGALLDTRVSTLVFALVGALFGTLLGALLSKVSRTGQEIRPADVLKWSWKNAKPWLVIGPPLGPIHFK